MNNETIVENRILTFVPDNIWIDRFGLNCSKNVDFKKFAYDTFHPILQVDGNDETPDDSPNNSRPGSPFNRLENDREVKDISKKETRDKINPIDDLLIHEPSKMPKFENAEHMQEPIIAIKIITSEEIDEIEKGISQDKMKKFLILKEKFTNRNNAYESSKMQYEVYQSMCMGSPNFDSIANKAKALSNDLKLELEKIGVEMRTLAKQNKSGNFIVPEYGERTTLPKEWFQIYPKIGHDSEHRMESLWNDLAQIFTDKGISKSRAKTVLKSRLEGNLVESFEIFSDLDDPREIAIQMSAMHDKPCNKAFFMDKLKNLERKEGESITNTMARLKSILRGIEKNRRPSERRPDHNLYIRHYLEKFVIDPKVFKEACDMEAEALDLEITFNTDSLIEACKYVEDNLQCNTMPSITTTIHNTEFDEIF